MPKGGTCDPAEPRSRGPHSDGASINNARRGNGGATVKSQPRPTPQVPQTGTPDRYIGVREIRTMLSVTDRWLRRAVSSERFPKPCLKLGRSLRWNESDVLKYVASNLIH